ncbi:MULTISPECIES: hypothetical protein [Providencia]|nr:hypothetical protein [Providencia stuartii]
MNSVIILGTALVNEKLTAAATYHDACDSSKLTYQWQLGKCRGFR